MVDTGLLPNRLLTESEFEDFVETQDMDLGTFQML